MIAARKPIPAPSASTGSTLTNSFDVRNRIFSGSRWIQLCCPDFFRLGGMPERVRWMARELSTSIRPPIVPRKIT